MYSVCSLCLSRSEFFTGERCARQAQACRGFMQILMKITTFELLNLLVCQTSTKDGLGDVAFYSIILFENSAIPWLVARLAYVNNVDKVMRNYLCSRKRNFHVHVSVDTVACHAVTVCKYANLHVVTQ